VTGKKQKSRGAHPSLVGKPAIGTLGGWGDEPAARGDEHAKASRRPSEPLEAPDDERGVETASGAHASTSPPQPRESSVAVREVLGFEVGLFSRLPAATSLRCAAGDVEFVITTSKAAYVAAREAGVPVFVGGELLALAHAAHNDRMWPADMRAALQRKRASNAWRLTPAHAFAGMPIANADPLAHATFGDVFERLDVRLLEVEVA